MRIQWTTKGNRDAGSSCSRDGGLNRYLRNFGGGGGLNPPPPLGTRLFTCIVARYWGWRQQSPDIAYHLYRAADVAVVASLLVYVRHWYEGDIAEGYRCCDGCERRTAGKVLVGTSVERNGVLFSRCWTGHPNGRGALSGTKKEFTSRIRSAIRHVIFQRWWIYGKFDSKRTTARFERRTARCCECSEFYWRRGRQSKILCNEMGVLVLVIPYDPLKWSGCRLERYNAFLLRLFRVPQLSRDVSANVGFICGKAAVLGTVMKETFCITPCV